MLARLILDLDFDEIERWFDKRGSQMPERDLFPKVGFIVDGVAAGFLYFTDSLVCIIDMYISNPDTDSKTRSDALDAITIALIRFAKSHRCKLLKCDSKLEVIKRRAISHGFLSSGSYESFTMEI